MCLFDALASPQHPPRATRTPEEEASFKRALKAMADMYASAVGTTVLQLKEIPPRPQAFDGRLCLFRLKPGVNEEAIRDAFGEVGLARCSLGDDPPTLLFPSHEAALRAKEVGRWSKLCEGVDTLYNERSYDGRHSGDGGRSEDNGRGW